MGGHTSDRRLIEVLSYVKQNGFDEAVKFFDLKPSTIKRHQRRADNRDLEIPDNYDNPDILVFDLETAPLEVYCFDTGKEYIGNSQIKKGRSLLSWSAKWLCDDEIVSMRAKPEEAINRNDKRLVNSLWALIHKADVLIGHNINRFDTNVSNTRFLANDLKPPSPYQTIDTYKQARRNFDFTSNSLDYITQEFCEKEKEDHDFELWKKCVEGEEEALEKMEKYNKADIRATEDLHFTLRPYYTSSVNLGLYFDGDLGNRCPRCGSKNIEEGNNEYYTSTGRYKTIRCKSCGGLGRDRFADITTEQRRELKRTLAR